MKLVVSFPIGVLGDISQNELYRQLHTGITQIVKEEDINGIQIYPANWPRKVLITVKDQTVKQSLLISGLDLKGQHVDLKDEGVHTVRITMKDAMIDWSDEKIEGMMQTYGTVIRIENEYVHIDQKPTKWKTGTRYIHMTNITSTIPNRLSTMDGDREITVSLWHNRHVSVPENSKCFKCGDMHSPRSCQFRKKVCYICKGEHEVKDCPKNDGSRSNKDVFCFMSEKSPLSNFNMKFPIHLQGQYYNCNEQFIQSKKAELFGDQLSYDEIMKSDDPRQMKQMGKRIKGYKDAEWKRQSSDIIMECVRNKVYSHKEIQDYLLATGDKIIGEGTPDPHFGVGIHIGDSRVLNLDEWTGNNIMGKALMETRSEIKLLQGVRDEIQDDSNSSISVLESTPVGMSVYKPAEQMVCSPVSTEKHLEQSELSNEDQVKCSTLLLGDSNAKGIHLNSSCFEVTKACISGATLQEVTDLMDDCGNCPKEVQAVLVQLGNYNWSADHTDSVEQHETVYREYIEAINNISHKFPHADLVVSSVPKRLPQGHNANYINEVNTEIAALNSMLDALALDEENIHFVDNDQELTVGGEPNPSLYVNSDMTGVHLNKMGLELVSKNITKELSTKCQKTSNNFEWQVSKSK